MKSDVLILSNVFDNFIDGCVRSYGLDPAWYLLESFYVDTYVTSIDNNGELSRFIKEIKTSSPAGGSIVLKMR